MNTEQNHTYKSRSLAYYITSSVTTHVQMQKARTKAQQATAQEETKLPRLPQVLIGMSVVSVYIYVHFQIHAFQGGLSKT